MAVYLNECEAGGDAHVVGFPHLVLCLGVVLQTNAYLYGFHFDNNDMGQTPEFAGAFRDYIQRKGGNVANGVHLYGCGNRKVRYGGLLQRQAWRNEMRVIANALNYAGPVSGFDTSVIDPANGTYVEYRRRPHEDNCDIFYKRNERMSFTQLDERIGAAQGKVFKWVASNNRRAGRWVATYGKITEAQLGPGAATLHELNYGLRLNNFTYP